MTKPFTIAAKPASAHDTPRFTELYLCAENAQAAKREDTMKRIWIPQVIVSVMLLWALNPNNPYSYYILLRWVCCGVFAYLAVKAYKQGHEDWVWVLGFIAALYNPIFRVHFVRSIWSVINVITIGIAATSVFIYKSSK